MRPSGLMYSTKPLKDALAKFDRTQPERDRHWDRVETVRGIEEAIKADDDAEQAVRLAFWEVTKDRNSKENSMRVDIEFARKISQLESTHEDK